jgi:hypothetical protein
VPEFGTVGLYTAFVRRIKMAVQSSKNQFSRHVDPALIKKLMADELWKNKLEDDCRKNKVFLAIRPGYISFYYKGGGLFKFDNKGFSTHVSYSVILDKSDLKDDYIYEDYLDNAKLIKEFNMGYDSIKKNCELYHKKSEEEGVSKIYHKFPYNLEKSDVVVLDIEVAFTEPKKENKRNKQNRIDILLYHKGLQKLRFIEAKKFDNKEIKAKNKPPPVLEQLQRYREMIDKKRKDILPAYQEYAKTLNGIFSSLSLPAPQKIDDNVGLLIFDFDENQRDAEDKGLKKHIKDNPNFAGIPNYCIGKIEDTNAESLWKKTE